MDLEKMKVAELRTELANRGLDTKGTKPVLLARLKEAVTKEESESPEPEVVGAGQVEAVEEDAAAAGDDAEEEAEEAMEEDGAQAVKQEEDAEMAVKADETPAAPATAVKEEVKTESTEAAPAANGDAPATNGEAKTEGDAKAADGKNAKQQRRGTKRRLNDDEPYVVTEDEPEIDDSATVLDWMNSDLHLKINKETFATGEPFHREGWGYVWAGARGTYGYNVGKVVYEVKVGEPMDIKIEGEDNLYELRVGWSADDTPLTLGESKVSYAYGGSAKKGTDCAFEAFGAEFGKGDIITAFADFDADGGVKLSFAKNGEDQGVAFEVTAEELEGKALFPHVSTRNLRFEVNFGKNVKGEEVEAFKDFGDFTPAGRVEDDGRVRGFGRIEKREDCEMIMLIGLPAAGKTTWVNKYVEENPDKRTYVIGTAALIEKMKVNGEPRKQHHPKDKWDALIQKCTRCLQDWLRMASQRRRNIAIDQTNVYPNAQKRKVRPFEGMVRKAVVIVPSEEDFKARAEAQEKAECKEVPDNAVMEMKANFTLPPESDSPFKEIIFTDLNREDATKLVETYNKDAKEKGFGKKQEQNRNKRQRGNNFRNRGGQMNQRGGQMRGRGGRGGMPMRGFMPFRGGRGGPMGMPFRGRGGPMGMPMAMAMRGGPGGPMRGGPAGPMRGNFNPRNQMNNKPQRGNNKQQRGNQNQQRGNNKQQRGNQNQNRGNNRNQMNQKRGGGQGAPAPWSQWQQPQQQRGNQGGNQWGNWNQGGNQMGGNMGNMGGNQMGNQMMGMGMNMGGMGGMNMGSGMGNMNRNQGGWGGQNQQMNRNQNQGMGFAGGNFGGNRQQQQQGGYPGNNQWGGFR